MSKDISRRILVNLIKSSSAPAVFLFILSALFVVFGTNANFDLGFARSFLNSNITVLCICIGEAVVILTGGIDISIGPLVSLCNVLVVKLIGGGMPVCAAIIVMLLVSVGSGALNGFMVGVMRINPLLTTYATSIIYGGLALVVTRTPIYLKTTMLSDFYGTRIFGVVPVTVVFILVPYFLWKIYKCTPAGIKIYAVGENELSAYCSGVNVVMTKMFAYCFAGFTTGIGALAITCMIQGGNPLLGASMSMTAVSAVVIGGVSLSGGKGDVGGGIFGCLFLFMLTNIIISMGINTFWQELLKTLILLTSVVVSVVISSERDRIRKVFEYVRERIRHNA
ncbi:MAG: ABC transporter permease [Treponema sp.]|jgi:ribose transport system permease protein|nr:ABC transporter permease [Treponema sp.]